jgi:hypothetical protein
MSYGLEDLVKRETMGSVCRLLLLVFCLNYSVTMKMEVIYSSETSGSIQNYTALQLLYLIFIFIFNNRDRNNR